MVGIQGASIVVSALAVVSGAVRAGGPGYCLVTTVQGRKRAPRGSVRGPSVEPAGVGVQACMNRTTRNSRPLSSDSRRVLHPSHHQHTGREHAHTCTTRIMYIHDQGRWLCGHQGNQHAAQLLVVPCYNNKRNKQIKAAAAVFSSLSPSRFHCNVRLFQLPETKDTLGATLRSTY